MVEQHRWQAQPCRAGRHLSARVVVDHHLNLGVQVAPVNRLGDRLQIAAVARCHDPQTQGLFKPGPDRRQRR